jgi:hypothetical protein
MFREIFHGIQAFYLWYIYNAHTAFPAFLSAYVSSLPLNTSDSIKALRGMLCLSWQIDQGTSLLWTVAVDFMWNWSWLDNEVLFV